MEYQFLKKLVLSQQLPGKENNIEKVWKTNMSINLLCHIIWGLNICILLYALYEIVSIKIKNKK